MTALVVIANGIAPMSYELRASRPDYLGAFNLRLLSNEDIKQETKGPVGLTPPLTFDWNLWQTKLLKDLAALQTLPLRPAERWRAKRPTSEACDAFTTFTRKINRDDLPSARVVPGVDGNIQLTVQRGKRELEIGFHDDGSLEYLTIEDNKAIEEGDDPSTKLNSLLDWLMR